MSMLIPNLKAYDQLFHVNIADNIDNFKDRICYHVRDLLVNLIGQHLYLSYFRQCLKGISPLMYSNSVNLLNPRFVFPSLRLFSNDGWLGCYDVVIIGGGIVGMASAKHIVENSSDLTCAVLEKESEIGQHQTGHNSGVIHAGIYYKPGSLKAKLCTEGMKLAYKYLDEKKIPYRKAGKLIVATDPEQLPLLDDLYKRGKENNVTDLKMLSSDEIKEVEPHCCGLKAIHSPHTGIVDWGLVTKHYGKDFKEKGGDIHLNFNVCKFEYLPESNGAADINKYPVSITSTTGKTVNAGYVLSCAGLYADQLAVISGGKMEPAIVPVRGEYLLLNGDKQHLIRGNIYPVPNPKFPFLGVHFTPRIDGSVWLGPNAVLAFKREGYSYGDVSLDELLSTMRYKGFQKLALTNLNFGLQEFMKSVFIPLQMKELQKFVPEITANDVRRGPSGVRAQAVNAQGELVDDFVFENSGERILHCRNAPSPAATSSLAIGRIVSEKVLQQIEALY